VFASTIVPTSSSLEPVQSESSVIPGIIPSGIALLDDWIGGVRDAGSHLLTGGSGSGKSSIALQFADAGLRKGEPVAMLVNSRVDDIKSHARFLGVNLTAPLRDGRLVLLRYRPDFVHRAQHAVSSEQVIADLARFVAPLSPSRIVIDSIAPFFNASGSVRSMALALAEWLERIGGSSLLTFPEDLAEDYDRGLEPLVQGAAAVIRLAREDAEIRRAELVNLRYPAPSMAIRRFVIRERMGIVAEHAIRGERLSLRAP
jgi:KaiC/GvpD/RAD55 family RecA-like ATPase